MKKLSSDLFKYNIKNRVMSALFSDLQAVGADVNDDLCADMNKARLTIVSSKTGNEMDFEFSREEAGDEFPKGWWFEMTIESKRKYMFSVGLKVFIINE